MGAVLVVYRELIIEKDARVAQIVMEECYEVDELYNGQWQKEKDVK
jgi:deoxycytidine triphosphate deaminase